MFLRQRQIIWRDGGLDTIIINVGDLKIPGEHNVENAMCAAALAISMGVSVDSIRSALKSFTGVEHRIEPVCEKKGVLYIMIQKHKPGLNNKGGKGNDTAYGSASRCRRIR